MRLRHIGFAAIVMMIGVALATAAVSNVLIINGSSTTSESRTTSSVTTNLQNDIVAAGGTPTVVDGIPSSIAGYSQVWDIRFSNSSPLSGADITKYVSYMASGGALLVMGENSGFTTRNNTVFALITAAGGGTLSFLVPSSTQTVNSPFTLPNAVSTITYSGPGGVGGASGTGTGTFMTVDGSNNGTGLYWNKTTMSNAPAGVLAVVFDVKFMLSSAGTNSQNFLKNLIGFYVAVTSAPATVPALSPLALMLLGVLLLGVAAKFARGYSAA